jgi:hypothetical protein
MDNLTQRQPLRLARGESGSLPGLTVLLCLSGGILPTEGHAAQTRQSTTVSAETEMTGDTVRPFRPRLFERRVFFVPEYLTRLLAAATAKRGGEEEEATPKERMVARAAMYAATYNIDGGLALQIVESAFAEGVDPDLAFRLIRTESVFRPNARGPQGALGLMQLMPQTARAIDRNLQTESQILDPVTNLRTGLRYLRMMIEKYGGDVRLGLLAYNRGEGTVDRALRQGRDPENGYSDRVLGTGANPYRGAGLVN